MPTTSAGSGRKSMTSWLCGRRGRIGIWRSSVSVLLAQLRTSLGITGLIGVETPSRTGSLGFVAHLSRCPWLKGRERNLIK